MIITEYDLPRKNAYPHDVVVDADGKAWYSDFGSQFMGVLDPKTGKVIDYDIPVVRPEQPKGTLDLQLDRDGNLWIAMMYQSAIAKMDRADPEADGLSLSEGVARRRARRPRWWRRAISHVDGKVWSNNQETREYYRLDVATGKFENTGKAVDKSGRQISAYGMPTDHDNNMYLLEFGGTSIGRRDAKTLEVEIWRDAVPGLAAAARRHRPAEPAVVRRIPRRHRDVRSEDQDHQGMDDADQVGQSLCGRAGARTARPGPAPCTPTW